MATTFPAGQVPMADGAAQRRQGWADLLSRVALGDRNAFEALYRQSSPHLLAVILRIQSNRAHAEDVLQEVYVNVWRAAQSFNPALSQASTWLGSVARNRAIDSLRRRQSEPNTVSSSQAGHDGEEDFDLLGEVASELPGPQALLEQAGEARQVQHCLKALSGEQQHSLALAFYQGLSHAEVAEHLGQPLGTVKSWLRRGLLSLKTCLERAATLARN
ncbi:sigma-70 family RNA polymerase sigma factor [Aquabacterium sp.]|uniref:sigma-70 family RNA polymerase sigma factor n=1 Tax=Aquabacterium sp. TaxID=1872578 RepID=UPI00248A3A1E|nr:sigma-70 family RNA polymerase sigma factor [Aquabacterium sp.]MDI1261100.1 sigma-70 family RNA polymerase sigma factor [Aquabacterium sp.]